MVQRALIIGLFFWTGCAYASQQIDDFYLSGFENKGEKNWEVRGKSADVEDENVKIKEVQGYTFVQDTKVNVKADTGDYNKQEGSMHLQDNVVIHSDDGVDLKTDSLSWDQKKNLISTDDKVVINKTQEMQAAGQGFKADTQKKTVVLEKDVEAKFTKKDSQGFVIITCEGPAEMDYVKGLIVFNKNVKMSDDEIEVYSDIARMFFDTATKKIDKVITEGNVKIVRGKDITYAQKATYYDSTKKVILEGKPKLIFFPEK